MLAMTLILAGSLFGTNPPGSNDSTASPGPPACGRRGFEA